MNWNGKCGEKRCELTTMAMPGLAVSSDPNLPAVEGKIQSANDHAATVRMVAEMSG